MREKPALRFWQIWNMCFGFFGIQFGFALQNANVSRIFQSLGASIDDLPVLWLAAPVTGLLVQPVIGYMSDRTWGRLGRRRPYFLVRRHPGDADAARDAEQPLALGRGRDAVDPRCVDQHHDGAVPRAGRRHAADRQRAFGFAMQSLFIGVGAVVASALPWMLANWGGVSNVAGGRPPAGLGEVGVLSRRRRLHRVGGLDGRPHEGVFARANSPSSAHADVAQKAEQPGESRSARQYRASGTLWLLGGSFFSVAVALFDWDLQLHVLGVGSAAFGVLQLDRRVAAVLGPAPRTRSTASWTTCSTCRAPCASSRSCSSCRGSACSRCGSTPRPR